MKVLQKLLVASLLALVLSAGSGPAQEAKPGEGILTSTQAVSGQTRKSETRPAATQPATARPPEAAAKALDRAHKLYWRGNYDQAIRAYRELAANPADAVAAGVGLAEALGMVGRYEQALEALAAVAQRAKHHADWHVKRSELLSALGRYDQALASARQAYKLRDDWAPAVACLGEVLETLGKKTEAIEVYESADKAVAKEGFREDARSLTAVGKILDRHAILTGKKASETAQNILRHYLQEAYDTVDKTYWPANIAAGMLLLNKHKKGEAKKEFDLALKLNKNLPDAHVGLSLIVLGRRKFEQALAQADKALKINPRHADALLARAFTYFLWEEYQQAGTELEKILKFNPNHLQALSTFAALHVRQHQGEKAQPFIKRVHTINPNFAQLYEDLGDWMSTAKQFDEAEAYYKKAIEMAPELAGPVTGLGMVYMQTGREGLAEATLAKAFAIDDYRADVMNYLNLLRTMRRQFAVKETEHFIIKVERKRDEVLLDWLADVAEKIHKDVCHDFQFEPSQKTLVEVFPNHKQFSMRLTGRGWIPTIGACTGRVIVMPCPDPLRGGYEQFNWYAVLRHEYTHTVTLAMTKNRIPHWFTEACAVWEQPDRRNFEAVGLLLKAVRHKKLYPIKELSWGFRRPDRKRGRTARSLAYAQSEWIFEYVDENYGRQAIYSMIEGFGDGWTQQRVFNEVLNTTEAQFDKDFAAWAKGQIKSWGFDPDLPPKVSETAKAAKAHPESADAQAKHALALYGGGSRAWPQAEKAAQAALEIEPRHEVALAVLAKIYARKKKYDDAIETALILQSVDPKSHQAARILAGCYAAKRQWPNAIPALETYKRLLPLDPHGYKELAKIWMQLGQFERALPNLEEMHRRTMKDTKYARQVADIHRLANRPAKALEFYEQVIQINPYDTGAYKTMASLYLKIGDHERAIRAMRSATLLEPDIDRTWAELAAVYLKVAQAEKSAAMLAKAREAAEKALELDPESAAKQILQTIDRTKL